MNCDNVRHLIHLHRPGERTENEEQLLQAHLRTCAACTAETESVRRSAAAMDRVLRSSIPPVHTAQETSAIMQRISDGGRRSRDVFETLLGLASRRSIQVAYGLLTIVAVVSLGEQLTGRQHQHTPPESTVGPYVSYVVDTRPLAQLSGLPVPETVRSTLLSQATIEVRKEDLERSVRLAGQAVLHTIALSREQRHLAEMVITSLGRTSDVTVRLGKIGG